ncbi:hydroxymethylbilane synthase [Polynucleobacter paneuropaeus]|uniref:Porphobilinogen deaminase n=1 Tax=Polynucleobacter paneuropaeus TaxID=2527775 RepID=A0ABX9FE02_9BURK|nr:hydroxymethylbilane synthase [Polynucleobacter paneuropaeus]MBT8516603.1 hydroxymethylbilane synthase [Polynucleobacter paneuropaeus]MBT8554840.1 hydroxymethylbilane synthase [Polynucleobacter paneuropaeus]MBT8560116.1 hydroxymethylbilane synthase [Polynucleobacter paneuropaeus]MBT8636473.1 hydroxymethylbilane synthase [Polynucleobacter paneuropaeus]MBT8638280.1 hydroxymethylbilane synthase [Polynucleobacter paneuropaeus]
MSQTLSFNSFPSALAAPKRLVIASRESRLAMWQAEHVRDCLKKLYPECDVQILGMTTRGDQILDRALSKVGGKGLFVKELEAALEDGRADLAVHSLKDVPMVMPEGFDLACVMAREDARDAFVSNDYASLEDLPKGAIVGTSSLRRESVLRAKFPHLEIQPLRGNLDTRMSKLDRGEYQAIILAAAGLKRLGLESRIQALLPYDPYTPAAGQGALGIETLSKHPNIRQWLSPLNDLPTLYAVSAERMVSRQLGGSCEVPLAAHAVWDQSQMQIRSFVASVDGKAICLASGNAVVQSVAEAEALGLSVAKDLIAQGAANLIPNVNK